MLVYGEQTPGRRHGVAPAFVMHYSGGERQEETLINVFISGALGA